MNLPKPHIIDAVWTDDYGREYHVVGRERLTAAEDEIARLTIDLAETERERQKVVEREAKTAEALTALGIHTIDVNQLAAPSKRPSSGTNSFCCRASTAGRASALA